MIAELNQLLECGILHAVVKHDLPFNIPDDVKHEINFLFFRFYIGVVAEKRIQYLERFTSGVKTLLA